MKPREAALKIVTESSQAPRGLILSRVQNTSDRALAEALANGTVKWQALLDYTIEAFSSRPLASLSPRVLWALRLGAFQLVMLGVPPHAAVSATVDTLKRPAERGYVNAVLRSVARHMGHIQLPSLDDRPMEYASTRFSYPDWIVELFVERFGLDEALKLFDFGNRPAPLFLRVNESMISREEYMQRLAASGVECEVGPIPASVKLLEGADVTALPMFDEGAFVVQDIAAQVVSLVVGAQEGESVWDACAAPGGKTAHLAEMMGGRGRLLATDIDPERAEMVRETVRRMGFSFVDVQVLDAASGAVAPGTAHRVQREVFDRILVDAPCSGLGVLRRNADLRWNRRPADLRAMASRQAAILDSAHSKLKPGGVLVYSTCTLTKEENEDTWERFLIRAGDMVPEDPASGLGAQARRLLSGEPFAGPGYRYLLPHESGTDGFFIARARKAAKGR